MAAIDERVRLLPQLVAVGQIVEELGLALEGAVHLRGHQLTGWRRRSGALLGRMDNNRNDQYTDEIWSGHGHGTKYSATAYLRADRVGGRQRRRRLAVGHLRCTLDHVVADGALTVAHLVAPHFVQFQQDQRLAAQTLGIGLVGLATRLCFAMRAREPTSKSPPSCAACPERCQSFACFSAWMRCTWRTDNERRKTPTRIKATPTQILT